MPEDRSTQPLEKAGAIPAHVIGVQSCGSEAEGGRYGRLLRQARVACVPEELRGGPKGGRCDAEVSGEFRE